MSSPEYEAASEIREALETLSYRLNAQLDIANAYLETLPSMHELSATVIFATLLHRSVVYPLKRETYNPDGVQQLAELAWLMAAELEKAGHYMKTSPPASQQG
jgi:hypothetical protein